MAKKVKLAYEDDAQLNQDIANDLEQEQQDFDNSLTEEKIDTDLQLDKDIIQAKQQVATDIGATNVGAVYNPIISELGSNISKMEEKRKAATQQDETMQRKARNMQMIAGISDGLASLANLIGVSKGGSNVAVGSALSPLEKKFEAARLERKADIKTIDDRLEQYKNQLLQMQLAKGSALASLAQNKDNQAFQKSMQEGAQAFQEKLAGLSHTRNLETLAKQQEFQKTMQEDTQAFTAEQNKLARESNEAIAANKALADITKTQIRYGNSGNKNLTQFVFDDPVSGNMRTINLSDKSLTNILSTYLPEAIKRGEITEEEAEEAKNWKSNEVSKTNLLGMVNKSVVMRQALLAAVGEEAENPKKTNTPAQPKGDYVTEGQTPYEPNWALAYTAGTSK